MEGWILVIVASLGFSLLLVAALCKVSGDCSRLEEEEEMGRRRKDGK